MMVDAKKCSAVIDNGKCLACKHGHSFTIACVGGGNQIPVCVKEDKLFDERRKVVTKAPWSGA